MYMWIREAADLPLSRQPAPIGLESKAACSGMKLERGCIVYAELMVADLEPLPAFTEFA